MDRSLDEIVSERHRGGRRSRNGGGRRTEYPRDGVRKWAREREDTRNIESEWVHDKFDDTSRQPARGRGSRRSPDRSREIQSAKLRVENIHYDLTQEELEHLFQRIGPVEKLSLQYDRSGRSEGVAYVTYRDADDAREAIREFDGANAAGQPIHLTLLPGPRPRRNPFDQITSSRPLADRITGRRANSDSPIRHSDVTKPPPDGVDRYIPGRGSRSPVPRRRRDGGGGGGGRRDGRRPGARRERGERNGSRKEGLARDGRPRKTQEELDAEMEDYFGGGSATAGGGENGAENVDMNGGGQGAGEDIEMAL